MGNVEHLIFSVDDSALARKTLEAVCASVGYAVRSFDCAAAALAAARTEKPSLILTDLVMQGMDGMDLLKECINDPDLCVIPVIMVTARTDTVLVGEALDAGAYDFIRKPFEEVEVLARIRSALRYSELTGQLRLAATTDSLTGLFNHGTLMVRLDLAIHSARSKNEPVSFLMADLDHFKAINDSLGHPAGDSVLQELSELLKKSFPQGITGRYGGEEFGVILPRYTEEMACRTAEAFRALIENRKFSALDKTLTISIGICACSSCGNGISAQVLVKRADDALYSAKKSGRNRVERASAEG